ncbi:MAG TPA: MFS transporter [Stellaceae bacterium]|nr:MFS transporter [Stellaceae bacterium]
MRAPPRETIVPLVVACALFMQNLDSTVIATALPTIARELHEDPLRLNLAITSYLLSLAVFIPVSGWMADRFGARPVFCSAIAVFMLGSAGCGLAQNLPMLIASRIVQGMGGAMMVPVGRLVLLRTVPKSDLVRAMAFMTMPALLGPVIGPPLGGFIVTYSSWRWIFYINLPICVLGITLGRLFILDVKEPDVRRLDVRGFVLAGVGLAGLTFGLEAVGRGALPIAVVGALIVGGLICGVLYFLHSRNVSYPIIDLGLLRIPTFFASISGGALFRIGTGAIPFLLPMLLQVGFGMTALSSGLTTFASSAGAMTMRATATPIIRRVGFRRVLIGNSIVASLFLLSYGFFNAGTPRWLIFGALLVGGFFRSLQFTCVSTIAYADVSAPLMSRATSLVSMMQQLSVSFGVGFAALFLHLVMMARGDASLSAGDFPYAFFIVSIVSAASILIFLRLAPEAGAEVSGHRTRRVESA